MTVDEKLAEEYTKTNALKGLAYRQTTQTYDEISGYPYFLEDKIKQAFLAGLKEGRPKWRNIFTKGEPYAYEYWDIPQDNLPNENFYFVKLKNGFVKICELKYDFFGKGKCFYNLKGGKQNNVAFWLEYPDGELKNDTRTD